MKPGSLIIRDNRGSHPDYRYIAYFRKHRSEQLANPNRLITAVYIHPNMSNYSVKSVAPGSELGQVVAFNTLPFKVRLILKDAFNLDTLLAVPCIVRDGFKGYYWRYHNTVLEGGMTVGIYHLVSFTFKSSVPDDESLPFEWRVYVGASLKGSVHELDGWGHVAERGTKLTQAEAESLFPEFKSISYAR